VGAMGFIGIKEQCGIQVRARSSFTHQVGDAQAATMTSRDGVVIPVRQMTFPLRQIVIVKQNQVSTLCTT
jgi:hypothetical protein